MAGAAVVADPAPRLLGGGALLGAGSGASRASSFSQGVGCQAGLRPRAGTGPRAELGSTEVRAEVRAEQVLAIESTRADVGAPVSPDDSDVLASGRGSAGTLRGGTSGPAALPPVWLVTVVADDAGSSVVDARRG